MLIQTRRPIASLTDYIDYYWYMDCPLPVTDWELSVPDGLIDLVVDLREDTIRLADASQRIGVFDSTVLFGPHSEHYFIKNSHASSVIGVRFKPGGAIPFVGVPMECLQNKKLSMHDIWGNRMIDLRDELLFAPTIENKFLVLDNRLSQWAVKPFSVPPEVQFALKELTEISSNLEISDIVNKLGVSHRRFIDMFKKITGFTPKKYRRIQRFQHALKHIHSKPSLNWAELAVFCGYYDQAHFTKDFQSFSGINPTMYHTRPNRHHNHVPVKNLQYSLPTDPYNEGEDLEE